MTVKEIPMRKSVLTLVLLSCACGSDTPADVAGTYTLSLTVQKNDCGIVGNAVGESSSGVQLAVTPAGSLVDAQVQGVAGLALALVMGSDTFKGNISGNALDLSISGTMPGSNGTCAYTRESRLTGKVVGDVITGSVTYRFVTNKTADCGTRDTCQDVQIFNGTRPPKVSP
jgi:hypothetical protein